MPSARHMLRWGILLALLSGVSCGPATWHPPQERDIPELGAPKIAGHSRNRVRPGDSTPTLTGSVVFPTAKRQAQATPAQIVGQATVSLIETNSGITVSSGLTDSAGAFTLNLGAFVPAADGTYLLEAVKGLMAQLPGFVSARMRTIVQYKAVGSIAGSPGWLSVTNASLPGSVVINTWTTAVAIESGLDPANVPPAGTIGKINGSFGLNPTPVLVGHPDAEIIAVRDDIGAYLAANLDPVGTVTAVKPTVTSVSPSSANAYGLVTVMGAGFSPVTGGSTVSVGGVAAPILMASPTQLIVQVAVGSTTGNLLVSTPRGGASNATPFTVPNGSAVGISALSPATVNVGGFITLSGWGYSSTLASNAVTFETNPGTVTATPTNASPTSLVVAVPTSARSGVVTVTVAGNQSNAFYLNVNVTTVPVTEIFPTKVTRNGDFYLYGSGFGTGTGTVAVGGTSAIIKRWRDTFIHAQLAASTPIGAQTLTAQTFAGVNLTSASTITVMLGGLGAFSQVGTITGLSGASPGVAWTHKWLYVLGGQGASPTSVAKIPLNADGTLNLGAQTLLSGVLAFNVGDSDHRSYFGFTKPGEVYWVGDGVPTPTGRKGYMRFADADGAFQSFTNAGVQGLASATCNLLYKDDWSSKALYELSSSVAPTTNVAYALVQSDGSIGGWTAFANCPNNACGCVSAAAAVGNRLYSLQKAANYYTPIAADGSLAAANGWTTAQANAFGGGWPFGVSAVVGDYLYQFGTYTDALGANDTNFYQASVAGGVLGNFNAISNPPGVKFQTGGYVVLGDSLYVFMGCDDAVGNSCTSPSNKVWRAALN